MRLFCSLHSWIYGYIHLLVRRTRLTKEFSFQLVYMKRDAHWYSVEFYFTVYVASIPVFRI